MLHEVSHIYSEEFNVVMLLDMNNAEDFLYIVTYKRNYWNKDRDQLDDTQ